MLDVEFNARALVGHVGNTSGHDATPHIPDAFSGSGESFCNNYSFPWLLSVPEQAKGGNTHTLGLIYVAVLVLILSEYGSVI